LTHTGCHYIYLPTYHTYMHATTYRLPGIPTHNVWCTHTHTHAHAHTHTHAHPTDLPTNFWRCPKIPQCLMHTHARTSYRPADDDDDDAPQDTIMWMMHTCTRARTRTSYRPADDDTHARQLSWAHTRTHILPTCRRISDDAPQDTIINANVWCTHTHAHVPTNFWRCPPRYYNVNDAHVHTCTHTCRRIPDNAPQDTIINANVWCTRARTHTHVHTMWWPIFTTRYNYM
jgi:hypothetical protein